MLTRSVARSFRISPWIVPVATVIVVLLLAALSADDDRWHRWFDYRRNDIAVGRWWQLATGHLMHWSTAHALLDAAAAIAVAWVFSATLRPTELAGASIVALGAVDAGLWFLHPEVGRYVGLSGVLHGWFAAGAVAWALGAATADGPAAGARPLGLALCVGLVSKLAFEDASGAFWLAGAGFPVVTAAHRWGAAGGAVSGIAIGLVRRRVRAGASDASRRR